MSILQRSVTTVGLFISMSAYCQLPGSIIGDRDGNIYHTVSIGGQLWMAENLKTTSYNDGTPIRQVINNSKWGEARTSAYCWYNNDSIKNKDLYGALYNWHAVNSEKLCPSGWRVPCEYDWTALADFLINRGNTSGQLKEESAAHWMFPNYGATNFTGFTALPGGARNYYPGNFYVKGTSGYWWSTTEIDSSHALAFSLTSAGDSLFRSIDNKKNGFSVRCMKNQKSGQHIKPDVEDRNWMAFVPPTGMEDILPPYDQWLPLMECYDSPACGVITKNMDASKFYLFEIGILPNGSYVTLFQLEHMVYINSVTKEIIKKVW